MKIEAVIFDLDSTLVDAFKAHFEGYKEAFSELGLEINEKEYAKFYGESTKSIIEALLKQTGSEADWREIQKKKQEYFLRNSEMATLLPGVRELLDSLEERGMKMAIATSARKVTADDMLKAVRLDFPGPITTEDEVEFSKPNPSIFILAAKKLDVDPKNCVVVEDSVQGIEAAKAAGMQVIGVLTGYIGKEKVEGSRPDLVVENLEKGKKEILEFLG